jgi:hypothetical protein
MTTKKDQARQFLAECGLLEDLQTFREQFPGIKLRYVKNLETGETLGKLPEAPEQT